MPYRVITKQGTFVQYKIWDFFGKVVWEVIDCLSKAGQERYRQIFGRELPKYSRKRNQILLRAGQRQLDPYFNDQTTPLEVRRRRAPYDRHYNPCPPHLQPVIPLPFTEQQAIKSQNGFKGYLYHIFVSNPLKYFQRSQQEAGVHIFSTNCQWEDIIRLELTRIRLGVGKLTQFLAMLQDWEELRTECGLTEKYVPSVTHYYRSLTTIGAQRVMSYFHQLRRECESYQLYDRKIDIWDARFLKSYSTGQNTPQTGRPSDSDVGVYVHHAKYWGIGYLESRVINARFRLPKYYTLVNPQQNDNQTFQQTFQAMVDATILPAEVLLADGGPKGQQSFTLVHQAGSTPLIAGPKNAAGLVLVTTKQRYFYARYTPQVYWSILDRLFDKRTRVEQSFGLDSRTYNLHQLPHLGYELSHQFVGLLNCGPLLTALTALKTDQFHLITRPGAFRRLGLAYQGLRLPVDSPSP